MIEVTMSSFFSPPAGPPDVAPGVARPAASQGQQGIRVQHPGREGVPQHAALRAQDSGRGAGAPGRKAHGEYTPLKAPKRRRHSDNLHPTIGSSIF